MTNPNTIQEKSTSQDSKLPKWLQGPVSSGRGELPIDSVEEDGTALDTAPGRSSSHWKAVKRTKRRLAEMEELHEFIRKKADSNPALADVYLDQLEKALNSTQET